VDELIMHLFRAYDTVPDPNFRRYIENQRDRYEDGNEDLLAEVLMLLACNIYDLIGHRSAVPGDNTYQVVALQAKTSASQEDQTRDNRIQRKAKHPEWKSIEPSEGEPKVKTVGAKMFNWCPYHKLWSTHTPKECCKGMPAESNKSVTTKQKKDLKPDPK
jgi:hypothetical protein